MSLTQLSASPREAPSQTIATSSRWVLAGTILSKPVQLFTVVMFARMLGAERFGLVGLVTTTAITLYGIVNLGLAEAANKFVAEYYLGDTEKAARYCSTIVMIVTVLSMILFAIMWLTRAHWSVRLFPPETPSLTIALCLCLAWLNLVFAVLIGVISAIKLFREVTILNMLQIVMLAIAGGLLARASANGALLAYVLSFAFSAIVAIKVIWGFDSRLLYFRAVINRADLKSIFHFSSPIWLAALTLNPAITFTYFFLAAQYGGSHELGLFSTANGLRMLVVILPGVIMGVVSPSLIQRGGQHGDSLMYEELLNKSFLAVVFLTLPLVIPLMLLSEIIFRIYGPEFHESARLFIPLVAAAAIAAVGTPLMAVLITKSKTWWSLAFGLAKSVVLIALTIWLVPQFLSMGLTWAVAISEIFFYVVALEFCIAVGAVPKSIRVLVYGSSAAIAFLVIVALVAPQMVRAILAIPLTYLTAALLVRVNPSLADWLADLAPTALRGYVRRLIRLFTAKGLSQRKESKT